MATIVVTSGGTVTVQNGDRVVIDVPEGEVVTIEAAGPNVRNFQVDFTDDTVSDTVIIDLSSFSSNNLQIQLNDYDPTDKITLQGAENGQIDPSRVDQYLFDYTGFGGQSFSGRVRLKDQGEKDFTVSPPPIIICFAGGTIIETDLGPTPVEALTVGSRVRTLDHGLQQIRWIGRRDLSHDDLSLNPDLRPIRISAGALGDGRPWTDLVVSPQHRVHISDWRAQLYFGEAEILVPAKALIDHQTILPADISQVTYWHILFDRHELVWSNGILSESLHPGEMAATAIGQLQEVQLPVTQISRLSRPTLRVREGRVASLRRA